MIQARTRAEVFFDIDYTIQSFDGSLRRGTAKTFAKLRQDGHKIHLWSGEGVRWNVVHRHGLDHLVTDVHAKPLGNYPAAALKVHPDFVIDDLPEIARHYGGYLVPEFYNASDDDDEMQAIYEVICDWVTIGASSNPRWQRGTVGRDSQGRPS